MFNRMLSWLKPTLGGLILLAVLQGTGLMGNVSYYGQSALLKTGIRNASAETLKKPETFDFNFNVRNAKGESIPFEKYKGKVIFLNMWATWCGPCRAEMPTIQRLYEKVDTAEVKFVILSVDREGDEPKIAKYIDQFGFTFPVYRPSGDLTPQLDVPSIPTTFIINKEGQIVSKKVGNTYFDTPSFRKFLLSLTQ